MVSNRKDSEQEPVAEIEVSPFAAGGVTARVWNVNLPIGIHKLYTLPSTKQVDQEQTLPFNHNERPKQSSKPQAPPMPPKPYTAPQPAKPAEQEPPVAPYNLKRIAWELERTALGDGFYGNALRVAKDLSGITPKDCSVLDRYATGAQTGTDHVHLQWLAQWLYHKYKRTEAPQPAKPAEQEPVEVSPEFTDTARAALLWVLWHHQGGSSPVGQPIRFALGMGAHDHLNEREIAEAKRWAALTRSTTAEFHAPQPDAREPPVWHEQELRNAIGLMRQMDEQKGYGNFVVAIKALEGLLATQQPAKPVEQEPVAQEWRYYFSHSGATGKPDEIVGPCFTDRKEVAFGVGCFDQTALYPPTPQPKREPLLDEDIDLINGGMCGEREFHHEFARRIIAAYEVKNGIGGQT